MLLCELTIFSAVWLVVVCSSAFSMAQCSAAFLIRLNEQNESVQSGEQYRIVTTKKTSWWKEYYLVPTILFQKDSTVTRCRNEKITVEGLRVRLKHCLLWQKGLLGGQDSKSLARHHGNSLYFALQSGKVYRQFRLQPYQIQ